MSDRLAGKDQNRYLSRVNAAGVWPSGICWTNTSVSTATIRVIALVNVTVSPVLLSCQRCSRLSGAHVCAVIGVPASIGVFTSRVPSRDSAHRPVAMCLIV